MVDFYRILGTRRGSTLQEIKRSFRKKAKELHPDLKISTTDSATSEEMLLLIQAYKILSNPVKREEYDRINPYKFDQNKFSFDYREYLKARKDDFASQSKLIYYDLINSNPEDALSLYEEMLSRDSYDLEKCLDRADYLECVFLLAEEFEKRREFSRAFEYLKLLYFQELTNPFFKHFIEEIIERMKNMVCYKMYSKISPEIQLKYLQDLIHFDFSNKDNAFFYKKMAEICLKCGKKTDALKYLKMGLKYNKKLTGIKKLKERIGI